MLPTSSRLATSAFKARRPSRNVAPAADFGDARVDRHRFHFHQQIVVAQFRRRQLDILERLRVADGMIFIETDGFHDVLS